MNNLTLLQAIIDSASDAICLIGEDRELKLINPAYERILAHVGILDLHNQNVQRCYFTDDVLRLATAFYEDAEQVAKRMIRWFNSTSTEHDIIRRLDGKVFQRRSVYLPGHGRLFITQDVTERARAETKSQNRPIPVKHDIVEKRDFPAIIGESLIMQAIKVSIGKVAVVDSHVLITGETGTGKEVVARAIHANSPRHRRPFIAINCAAIPESLFESELFGYERGAFTGAQGSRAGAFEMANEGTVFLDEIGELSPCAQAKILRVIETKVIDRLGGRRSTSLNIRVITATNQDLEHLVTTGGYRSDLYFRLNVARIHLPPLRERTEDIPLFLEHIIEELNDRFGTQVEGVTAEALDVLRRYPWPGNVRELKNLIEATCIHLSSQKIGIQDFPDPFRQRLIQTHVLPQNEAEQLLAALRCTHWNVSHAAQKLRWSRMTVYRKMTKYNIARGQQPQGHGHGHEARTAPAVTSFYRM